MTIGSATSQNLSPLQFLERSATVYPRRAACVYNGAITTYGQLHERGTATRGGSPQCWGGGW